MRTAGLFLVLLFVQARAGANDHKAIATTNFDEQVKELETYLDRELAKSEAVRKSFWKRDLSSIMAYEQSISPYREKLKAMIGRPENSEYDIALNAEQLATHKTLIAETSTHKSFRTSFTSRNGVTVYGILLVPNQASRNPAVVCIHGMGGSPEQVAGLIEPHDYTRGFGRRLAERGYVVFAPLMTNTGKLRERFDRTAIMIGSRLQWIEQEKIFSVIDLLQSLPEVNPERIGVYGISWGGRTVMYQRTYAQELSLDSPSE